MALLSKVYVPESLAIISFELSNIASTEYEPVVTPRSRTILPVGRQPPISLGSCEDVWRGYIVCGLPRLVF